jgi:hypothetical protein
MPAAGASRGYFHTYTPNPMARIIIRNAMPPNRRATGRRHKKTEKVSARMPATVSRGPVTRADGLAFTAIKTY